MRFNWPHLLWLLVAVPSAIAVYWGLLRRRSKLAHVLSDLQLVREAAGRLHSLRRHIPPCASVCADADLYGECNAWQGASGAALEWLHAITCIPPVRTRAGKRQGKPVRAHSSRQLAAS